LHSRLAGSSAEKAMLAEALLLGSAGPAVIVVTGAVRSTRQV
jgi:hypothetical protein